MSRFLASIFLTAVLAAGAAAGATSPRAWRIAVDGSDGSGDGSLVAPFATFQHAIDQAADGDSVIAAAGTYRGVGNRDIDFLGKRIVVTSASLDPATCTVDCEGTAGAPHQGFYFHSDEDTTAVLQGLTVTGSWEAEGRGAVTCGGEGDFFDAVHAAPRLRLVLAEGNIGAGLVVRGDGVGPVLEYCSFSWNDGPGALWTGLAGTGRIRHCRFQGNAGAGLLAHGDSRRASDPQDGVMWHCGILGNGGDGFSLWAVFDGAATLVDCDIVGNGGWGVRSDYGCEIRDSLIEGNGTGGVRQYGYPFVVSGTRIVGNQACGLELVCVACDLSACDLVGNHGPGLMGEVRDLNLDGCLLAANEGPGVALAFISYVLSEPSRLVATGVTVAANAGAGLRLTAPDSLRMGRVLIAGNDGAAVDATPGVSAIAFAAACSDLHGNGGGDWTGPLAALAGIDGNVAVDPLFCGDDNPDEPWGLAANSPCAAAISSCGTIGARDALCAAVTGVDGPPRCAVALHPCAPNPANPGVTVRFTLDLDREIDLTVHRLDGGLVRRLARGPWTGGEHSLTWDGKDAAGRSVASGVYVLRLDSAAGRQARRVTLLR